MFPAWPTRNVKAIAAIEAAIREQMSSTYEEFRYLLNSTKLMLHKKNTFQKILDKVSSISELKNAIKNLSKYIYANCDVYPYLLIDEYDTPIHSAYSKDYYADVLDLIRAMLCTALKGNANIKQGILSGITRITKESIFSGLNNLKTRSFNQLTLAKIVIHIDSLRFVAFNQNRAPPFKPERPMPTLLECCGLELFSEMTMDMKFS